jgi:hypothetical protein
VRYRCLADMCECIALCCFASLTFDVLRVLCACVFQHGCSWVCVPVQLLMYVSVHACPLLCLYMYVLTYVVCYNRPMMQTLLAKAVPAA